MRKLILAGSTLCMLYLTGCATSRITDYHPSAPATTERMTEQTGLEVAVDPFVEKDRTEKYFDINAVGQGIAILHLRLTNKSANQTFLVEKENIRLMPVGADNGMTGNDKQIERSRSGAEAVELAGVIGIGLGGLATGPAGIILVIAGASMESNASEVQRNFVSKEMPDQTLSPGQSMEGFVYFSPVKKGEDWSRATQVRFNLTETKSQQAVQFSVPLAKATQL